MFTRLRFFFADARYWLAGRFRRRRRAAPPPAPPQPAETATPEPRPTEAVTGEPKPATATGTAKPEEGPSAPAGEPATAAGAGKPEEEAGAEPSPSAAEAPRKGLRRLPRPRLRRRRGEQPKAPRRRLSLRRRRGDRPPKTPRRRPSLPRPRLPRRRGERPARRPRLWRRREPGRERRRRLPRPSRRLLSALVGLVLGAGIVVAAYLLIDPDLDEDEPPAPAPRVVVREQQAQEVEEAPELGFPAFATKNTTRISGPDPVADAAGAALAVFPATGGLEGPDAVSLVGEDDWASGVAAASLMSEPIGAPVLYATPEEVPDLTLDALTSLAPRGSTATGGDQLFRVGDVATPEGLRTRAISGENPAEVAVAVAELRERLSDEKPEHILLASSDEPAYAMPAAAWAARSGDPVLFVQRNTVPTATLDALERYDDVPVFLLGPEQAASDRVVSELEREKIEVDRIAGETPVENAIDFARFSGSDGFGWAINDPGHGLVVANAGRPADAGAAAALSASGKWGPLLLVEDADVLPPELEGYLLDIKPGYVDDPTRALYNHVWLIGDSGAIGIAVQAQIDELSELAKVRSGSGDPGFAPAPSESEEEERDRGS